MYISGHLSLATGHLAIFSFSVSLIQIWNIKIRAVLVNPLSHRVTKCISFSLVHSNYSCVQLSDDAGNFLNVLIMNP